MRLAICAAATLAASTRLSAQAIPDLGFSVPIAGNWTYSAVADGTEAVFADTSGRPQLWVHCNRPTRRVSIARPSSLAMPFVALWTSSQTRSVPASFNPSTGRVTIELGAGDALLDALANSRGRVGLVAGTQPPLVVPNWPEVARVIEDCRA